MPAVTTKGPQRQQKVTNSKKKKPDKDPGGGTGGKDRCLTAGKSCTGSVYKCCKSAKLFCISGKCQVKDSGGGDGGDGGDNTGGGGDNTGGGGSGSGKYTEYWIDRSQAGSVNKWGPLMERRDYPAINDVDEMKAALDTELDVISQVYTAVEVDVANVDLCWANFREGDTITVGLGYSGYSGAIRVMVRALDVDRGVMTVAGASVDGR